MTTVRCTNPAIRHGESKQGKPHGAEEAAHRQQRAALGPLSVVLKIAGRERKGKEQKAAHHPLLQMNSEFPSPLLSSFT